MDTDFKGKAQELEPQINTDFGTRLASMTVLLFLSSVFICVHPWKNSSVFAQEAGEIVANVSSGRVLICVTKEGIAIGAYESKTEAESRPPAVVALSKRRAAILLGATEWADPGGGPALRLENELPRLAGQISGNDPRLTAEKANDLEAIGLGLLEIIRPQTAKIHRKLDLGEDEPLVELIIVGYVPEYGAEVWSLQYRIAQEPLRGDFYRTRILRPRYTQLYPPEKGQPKTLVEAQYPPASDDALTLRERLKTDPALAAARTSTDPVIATASGLIEGGQSDKAKLDPAVQWLRGLLNATAPPDAVQAFAIIREAQQSAGFEWILEPPKQPERDAPARDPNAPTLKKKP